MTKPRDSDETSTSHGGGSPESRASAAGKRDLVMLTGLVLLAAYLCLCAQYVYRTSFEHAGGRVFVLWDDAMISMQYAKNLAIHGELAWNAGKERVLGISNFGVALLMSPIHLLPVPLQKTSLVFQILNFAFLVSTIYLTGRLCETLFESRWAGVGAVVVTSLYAPMTIWSLQGSDVGVVALLLVSVFLLFVRARVRREAIPNSLFAVLAVGIVMRLDFTIVYVLFLLFALPVKRDARRALGVGLPVLLGTWAFLAGFNAVYYGSPLPNTFFLKATGAPRELMLATGWYQAKQIFAGAGLVHLVLFVQYALLLLVRNRLATTLVAAVAVFLGYTIWIGGDWVTLHSIRFFVPVVPLYIVVLVGGSWELLRAVLGGQSALWQKAVFAGHLVLFVSTLSPRASLRELYLPNAIPMYQAENRSNYRYADYFCRMTEAETTIGVFWAGLVPYFCDRYYIDVLGKSDAHIARLTVDRFAPGHSKWDWDYVLNVRRPDILASETPELRIRDDYQRDYCTARGELVYHLRYESRDRVVGETPLLCSIDSKEVCFPCLGPAQSVSFVFDFEEGLLSGWEIEGSAFGPGGVYDSRTTRPGQSAISGHRGTYLVNSYHPNDDGTGRLRSPPFPIESAVMRLRVGGGMGRPDALYVGLEVDGRIVRSATGHDSETLRAELWDVRVFEGRTGRLVIVDHTTGPWGHILVDAVEFITS